jgi:hypothetical protein
MKNLTHPRKVTYLKENGFDSTLTRSWKFEEKEEQIITSNCPPPKKTKL